MRYYSKYFISGLIILIGFVLLVACSTSSEIVQITTPEGEIILSRTPTPIFTPTSTRLPTFTPLPTATPTPLPTFTPAPTLVPPTLTPLSLDVMLQYFPLKAGNSWVYSSRQFADNYNNPDKPSETGPDFLEKGLIRATYRITETVTETNVYTGLFVAKMVRESAIASTPNTIEEVINNDLLYEGTGRTTTYWYIISGPKVYRQEGEDLDLTMDKYTTMEYVFPLDAGIVWDTSGWIVTKPGSGRRANGPIQKRFAGEEFDNCFEMIERGGFVTWFCSGIGFMGEEFYHSGTPFGHETVLIDYNIESP